MCHYVSESAARSLRDVFIDLKKKFVEMDLTMILVLNFENVNWNSPNIHNW